MTTDKAFKRVVRARMAKTGERYAAARRTLVEGATDGHHAEPTADAATPSGYRMRGGLHPETATLANVLANQGVVSGVTGEPLTEAAILGIGGGLGAGYILWEFKSHGGPVLTLGFRNQPQYPSIPGWTGKTLDRLGIEPDVHETGGAKGAREALDARLDAGMPVIASVDLQSVGTWGLPDALSGYFGLVVVVFGRDADGSYLMDDRGRNPFRVSPAVMAAARGRIGSFKHRIVGLQTTPGPIPADRLRAAMRAGLEDQVDHLRSPSDSFSLPAWRKWGRLMTEAAILGIGGGLGAGYILWEFQAQHRGKIHGGPVLTLGFRNQWQYPSIPGWTGKTLDRLGIEPDLHETGGAKGAREALDARLDAGVPVIASSTSSRSGPGASPTRCRGTSASSSSSSDVTPMARTSWMIVAGTHSGCHRP